MFVLDEKEKDYRFGDSGPKYLMKGPRSNFAVVRFNPGQDFPAHYHEIMEENFYVTYCLHTFQEKIMNFS